MTAGTGHLGHGIRDSASGTGHPGQGIGKGYRERIYGTGYLGQDNQDRTAREDSREGYGGKTQLQERDDKRTTLSKQLGHDSRDNLVRKGLKDRVARLRQPGQKREERMARTLQQ